MEDLHSVLSFAKEVLSPLIGVIIGGYIVSKQNRTNRELDFKEKQLREFYGPLYAKYLELRSQRNLRQKIQDNAAVIWPELCREANKDPSRQAFVDLQNDRFPEFENIIHYDNEKFLKTDVPLYKEFKNYFYKNIYLADKEALAEYPKLVEFIDIWERWLDKAIPPEVVKKLGHTEENLKPLYNHLERQFHKLQKELGGKKHQMSCCTKNNLET